MYMPTTIMSRRKQLRPFKVQDDDDSNTNQTKSADNGLSTSSNGHSTDEAQTLSKLIYNHLIKCLRLRTKLFSQFSIKFNLNEYRIIFQVHLNQVYFKIPYNLLFLNTVSFSFFFFLQNQGLQKQREIFLEKVQNKLFCTWVQK